jgi:hypothetical protein
MRGTVNIPTYFGSEDAPLFGVLTLPSDGRVRAGVLVCPSIGKEQAETTRGLKLFGERLAARGFAVLRFDYHCTGESSGAQYRADAADEWVASIPVAADYLRSLGSPVTVAVGHRVGALLLARAEDVVDTLDALVLWDPVGKGRQYVRAKTVLYNMVSELADAARTATGGESMLESFDPEVAYLHTAGQSLHPTAAARFGRFVLPVDVGAGVPPDRRLALVRETDRGGGFAKSQADQGVRLLELGDQHAFLEPDHPGLLSFPVAEFDQIVRWLDEVIPTETTDVQAVTRDSAVIAATGSGLPIVTRLRKIGQGWVWDTAIEGHHETATEVLVAHSLGQYVRTGPSRLWYEAAISVAVRGGRTVRFDRRTVGESGTAAVTDQNLALHTRGYIADGTGVVAGLTFPPGATVAHSGICVGAWMSGHAAVDVSATRPGVTSAVVLVNNLVWRLAPVRVYRPDDLGGGVELAGAPRVNPAKRFGTRLRRAMIWRIGRSGPTLRRVVPRPLIRAVGALPMVQLPDAMFATLATAKVRTHLVFSPADSRVFEDNTGGPEAVRRARPPVSVEVAAAGDHTAYHISVRQAVVRECLRALGL